MVILFDLLGAQPDKAGSKFHGGGEYIKTIFNHLVSKKKSEKIIVFYNKKAFLDEWILRLIVNENIESIDVEKYEDLAYIFQKEHIDIYYSGMPYGDIVKIVPSYVFKIGTFHGLRVLECPTDKYEYMYYDDLLKSLKAMIKPIFNQRLQAKAKAIYESGLNGFDLIITDSYHSKYSFKVFYPELDNKEIKVYYAPKKHVEISPNEEAKQYRKYILLLGLNRWEKNGFRAIQAIESLFSQGRLSNYKIVLVGRLPNRIKTKLKHEERYIILDYVSPEKLESLYKYCDMFIYPSLNEGFGMPPLEAMAYGRTCVVAADTSLPEVCGDAVYYFNPYDQKELESRILMAVENKILEEKINKHMSEMLARQNEDLDEICEYILGKNINEMKVKV